MRTICIRAVSCMARSCGCRVGFALSATAGRGCPRATERSDTSDDMARKPRIAIIGGGIGGLAAARALLQRGIEVTVYEQASRISEFGAGVVMTPNAMKALRSLGLEGAVQAVAVAP